MTTTNVINNRTDYLTISKGKMYFRLDSWATDRWRLFGNCPEIKLTYEVEAQEHTTAEEGIQQRDLNLVKKLNAAWSLKFEEIKKHNLQMLLVASAATVISQAKGTNGSETFSAVEKGEVLQLNKSEIYDVVVTDDTTPTPVTFTANTDYVVNSPEGMVEILEEGGIADGTNLVITYKFRAISQSSGSVTGEAHAAVDQGDIVTLAYHHVSSVVVKDDATPTPETFVVGDDYIVDADAGTITIVDGGGIADGTNLVIDYDYATVEEQHRLFFGSNVDFHEAHIKFIGNSPRGQNVTIRGYADIQPDGDLTLTSDELFTGSLKGTFLVGHGYVDSTGKNVPFELDIRGITA